MRGRPRLKSQGRRPQTHRNEATPLRRRVEIAKFFAETNNMPLTLERFFGELTPAKAAVVKRRVYRWKNDLPALEAAHAVSRNRALSRLRQPGTATALSPDSDKEIVTWLNLLRKDGVPVSRLMLQAKALDVAAAAGLSTEVFKASYMWQRAFMKGNRLAIRARTRHGQTTPVEAQSVLDRFSADLARVVEENGVVNIYNADQTGVWIEYLPKTTINDHGAKTVWVKSSGREKERITAMLLGDAKDNKYNPFLVFKASKSTVADVAEINERERNGFGVRLFKTMEPLINDPAVEIYGNPTAWWNEDLSVRFLDFHFGSRKPDDPPVLLLWADFSSHWTEKVTARAAALGVILHKVPPRYTYVCQPADISWNKPLKDYMRSQWMGWIAYQVRENGRIKPPSRTELVTWLKGGWARLTTSMIWSGFKRAKIQVWGDDGELYADQVHVPEPESVLEIDGEEVASKEDIEDDSDDEE